MDEPRPWTTNDGVIWDADGGFVARVWEHDGPWGPSRDIRVAHDIKTAVNAHDDLVAELDAELAFLEKVYAASLVEAAEGRRGISVELLKDRVRSLAAALKLAKGEAG